MGQKLFLLLIQRQMVLKLMFQIFMCPLRYLFTVSLPLLCSIRPDGPLQRAFRYNPPCLGLHNILSDVLFSIWQRALSTVVSTHDDNLIW